MSIPTACLHCGSRVTATVRPDVVCQLVRIAGKAAGSQSSKNANPGCRPCFTDVRLFASHMASLTLDNPICDVADAGSVAVHQRAALKPRVDYDTWIVRAIEQALSTVQLRLQGGMALLATIDLTASAHPPADTATPDEPHPDRNFDSGAGSLCAHLSSPNASPGIWL